MLEKKEIRVIRVILEQRVCKVFKECKATKERKEMLEKKEIRVIRE